MSYPSLEGSSADETSGELARDARSSAWYQFRYLPGIVGESQRVVHQAVSGDDERVWSLCTRTFETVDIEVVTGVGMPCLGCVARAAVAATAEFHGEPPVIEGAEPQ